MKSKKTLGPDLMNQQKMWPSSTRLRTAAGRDQQQKEAAALCMKHSGIPTRRASLTPAAALCMHIKLLDCPDDTWVIITVIIAHIFTLEQKKQKWHTKKSLSEIRTPDAEVSGTATYLLPHSVSWRIDRDWNVSTRSFACVPAVAGTHLGRWRGWGIEKMVRR